MKSKNKAAWNEYENEVNEARRSDAINENELLRKRNQYMEDIEWGLDITV